MSADIDQSNGRANFAYTGETPWWATKGNPWQSAGLQLPGPMTAAQAIVAGGLDWAVLRCPTTVTLPDGTVMPDPGSFANVRADTKTILGRVSPTYQAIQNVDSFSWFDSTFGENAAVIETVGALGNGGTVFACARMSTFIDVKDGDVVEQWLVLANSHDGTGGCNIYFTTIRVVCRNTLNASMGTAKYRVTIRHTKGAMSALADAQKAMVGAERYFTAARDFFRKSAQVQVTVNQVNEMLDAMFPGKRFVVEGALAGAQAAVEQDRLEQEQEQNKRAKARIVALFEGEAVGAELAGKTAWGALNAATQWIDRERPTRGTGGDVRAAHASRWNAAQFGAGSVIRQSAVNYLRAQVVGV